MRRKYFAYTLLLLYLAISSGCGGISKMTQSSSLKDDSQELGVAGKGKIIQLQSDYVSTVLVPIIL